MGRVEDRGDVLLGCIYDEVDREINPSGDDCSFCGGEGVTYDCFDGCCIDAEEGCEDCARKCVECVIFNGKRSRLVREAVIKSDDIDIAKAWLKSIGRMTPDVTDERIRAELAAVHAIAAKVSPHGR